MALQKNKLELIINGEKLQFSLSPDEIPLYESAEELINKRISDFNKLYEGKKASPTQFLKAIMVKLAVELLKKENQRANTEGKISPKAHLRKSTLKKYRTEKGQTMTGLGYPSGDSVYGTLEASV